MILILQRNQQKLISLIAIYQNNDGVLLTLNQEFYISMGSWGVPFAPILLSEFSTIEMDNYESLISKGTNCTWQIWENLMKNKNKIKSSIYSAKLN